MYHSQFVFQAFEASRRANEAVMQALLAAYQNALDVQRAHRARPCASQMQAFQHSASDNSSLCTYAPFLMICTRIVCSLCYAGRALIDINCIAEVYAEKPLPMEPWLAAERWPTDPCHMRSYHVKRVKHAVSSFWWYLSLHSS